jgi:tetratricopeptide (TPR) repeat protein
VEACKDDPEAHHHFAELLWHQGKRREGLAEMAEAAKLSDGNAALRVRMAEMRHEAGELRLAEQCVQQALDLDPKLPAAWAARGRIMRDLGQLSQALADFHRALGLAPGDPNIQVEIAEIYRRLNQPERALAALDSALGGYSPGEEPQRILYLQGLAYAAAGRYEDAVESYSTACIRADPTAEILYRLAESESLAGRTARAAEAAQEALQLDPHHRPSRVLLARILRPSGNVLQR